MKTVNPDITPTVGKRLLAEPFSIRTQDREVDINVATSSFIDKLVGEEPIAKVALRPIEQTTLNREFQRLLEQIPDEDNRYRCFVAVFSAVDAVHGVKLSGNRLTAGEGREATKYIERDREKTEELLRGVLASLPIKSSDGSLSLAEEAWRAWCVYNIITPDQDRINPLPDSMLRIAHRKYHLLYHGRRSDPPLNLNELEELAHQTTFLYRSDGDIEADVLNDMLPGRKERKKKGLIYHECMAALAQSSGLIETVARYVSVEDGARGSSLNGFARELIKHVPSVRSLGQTEQTTKAAAQLAAGLTEVNRKVPREFIRAFYHDPEAIEELIIQTDNLDRSQGRFVRTEYRNHRFRSEPLGSELGLSSLEEERLTLRSTFVEGYLDGLLDISSAETAGQLAIRTSLICGLATTYTRQYVEALAIDPQVETSYRMIRHTILSKAASFPPEQYKRIRDAFITPEHNYALEEPGLFDSYCVNLRYLRYFSGDLAASILQSDGEQLSGIIRAVENRITSSEQIQAFLDSSGKQGPEVLIKAMRASDSLTRLVIESLSKEEIFRKFFGGYNSGVLIEFTKHLQVCEAEDRQPPINAENVIRSIFALPSTHVPGDERLQRPETLMFSLREGTSNEAFDVTDTDAILLLINQLASDVPQFVAKTFEYYSYQNSRFCQEVIYRLADGSYHIPPLGKHPQHRDAVFGALARHWGNTKLSAGMLEKLVETGIDLKAAFASGDLHELVCQYWPVSDKFDADILMNMAGVARMTNGKKLTNEGLIFVEGIAERALTRAYTVGDAIGIVGIHYDNDMLQYPLPEEVTGRILAKRFTALEAYAFGPDRFDSDPPWSLVPFQHFPEVELTVLVEKVAEPIRLVEPYRSLTLLLDALAQAQRDKVLANIRQRNPQRLQKIIDDIDGGYRRVYYVQNYLDRLVGYLH